MSKKETFNALIFIDTNIFLDFYRIRRTNVSMKYLDEIVKHKDIIITSSQIEMEFKSNRQSAILESISEVTKAAQISLSCPAVISESNAIKMIKKSKDSIQVQQNRLKNQIERILKNPKRNDPVYKNLEKIFVNKSSVNLTRENAKRYTIRNLAKKRFILGYPPKKKSDNSIGDAINWEWIIDCAIRENKDIIIVTRDNDYGTINDNYTFINDWLMQEFKQRVGYRRKLILTDKLSQAFKLVKIPVTKEMIDEEEKVITETKITKSSLQKNLSTISEIFNQNLKTININEFPILSSEFTGLSDETKFLLGKYLKK